MKLSIGIWGRLVAIVALGLHGATPARTASDGSAVAEWLATEGCGDFLVGDLKLVGSLTLKSRGFSDVITKQDSKLGPLELISAKFDDGEIVFGGAVDKICTVVVTGKLAAKSQSALRNGLHAYGVEFERVTEQSKALSSEMSLETFKSKPIDGTTLYILLIDSLKAQTAMTSFQIVGSKE